MSTQPNCSARIDGELQSTLEYIRKALAAYYSGESDDDEITEDSLFEYGLSFDYVPGGTDYNDGNGYFRWQLSYGGPSDEFRFYADADLSCHYVEYAFLDWFDGATREVTGKDKAMMLEIYTMFDDMGSLVAELDKAQ